MINLNDFIIEKLKVSSSNALEIDFDAFVKALYKYSNKTGKPFDLEYLNYFKDLPDDKFPYFENPYSTLDAKGYIKKIDARKYKEEYSISLFYREFRDKKVLSVTSLKKDHFKVLTDAIEPEELQEIYDYLVDHA